MSTDEPAPPDSAPDRTAESRPPEPRTAESGPAEPLGGEPACMLDRVCPACGRLADTAPPTVCARCGASVGDPD